MGIKFSRYFVSASFYAHFYFYKRKEKKIDKTKRDAEKYIEKTKLILEIHSRGLREKDFSLSQLHELQNYLERTEK